jgi:hypothetical protein
MRSPEVQLVYFPYKYEYFDEDAKLKNKKKLLSTKISTLKTYSILK